MNGVIARERRRVARRMFQERRGMEPDRFVENLTDPLFLLARQASLANRLLGPGVVLFFLVLIVLATAAFKAHRIAAGSAISRTVGSESGEPFYRWSGYHRVGVLLSE